MPRTVLITGCSSGIGKATALHFAENGWNVSATMRKPDSEAGKFLSALSNVLVSALDVCSRPSIDAAVAATLDKFESIDVVINNAGYLLGGPAEFATKQQVIDQLDTNVYGPLAVTQAVLPHFRSRCAGLIINVSSLVGRIAFPFMSMYVASKYALEGLSEGLNLELVPLGIRVKIVEPGVTITDYAARVQMADHETETAYSASLKKNDKHFGRVIGNSPSSAEHVAVAIFKAATDGQDTVRYPIGEDTKIVNHTRAMKSDEEWEKFLLKEFEFLE